MPRVVRIRDGFTWKKNTHSLFQSAFKGPPYLPAVSHLNALRASVCSKMNPVYLQKPTTVKLTDII